MSSPGNTFSAPDNDQVPYTISAQTAAGAAYVPQAGDLFALTSTDGHSTVSPNPADPTGATGFVSDTAAFDGPVSGAISFTPGPAAVAQGIQPALGTWTGTFVASTQSLSIAVQFGAPSAPAAPAASSDVAANRRVVRS